MIGHRAGAKVVARAVQWAKRAGISSLSIFCFSTENWSRPADEVSGLMRLFDLMLRRNFRRLLRENVRLRWLGKADGLPKTMVETLRSLEEQTADRSGLQLFLAINYSGRDEAVRAAAKCYGGISVSAAADWNQMAKRLDCPDMADVDLLIRTSGEMRLSNFLLLQSAYAELYFTDCLWPDFDEKEFLRAIATYGQRQRRFGATAPPDEQH
jgi:undecaprenyl diphosphate synthase